MFKGICRLTPEIVKNSKYDFNIIWGTNQFLCIKLSEKKTKKTNKTESISGYDKHENPTLIPPVLMKKQDKVVPTDGLSLLDRYL